MPGVAVSKSHLALASFRLIPRLLDSPSRKFHKLHRSLLLLAFAAVIQRHIFWFFNIETRIAVEVWISAHAEGIDQCSSPEIWARRAIRSVNSQADAVFLFWDKGLTK